MLYRLVTGQAQTQQQRSHLLRISRNTVGQSLAIYHAGALPA
jgi:hypothetical protein